MWIGELKETLKWSNFPTQCHQEGRTYPICCQRQFPQHLAVERDLGAGPQRRNLSSLKDKEDIGFVCVRVCMWMLTCVRLFATPWTIACQGHLSMGLFPARKLEQVNHFLCQGIFLTQGIEPMSPVSPAVGRRVQEWDYSDDETLHSLKGWLEEDDNLEFS